MAYLVAFAVFLLLAAACWFAAVALYQGSVGGHPPAATPDYANLVGAAVVVNAVTGFVPNPAGFALGSLVWAVAVANLAVPAGRKVVLGGYLLAASVIARLAVLGILDVTK
ncbi:hypothetical protein [Limnoglobus roseus]|uniref:Uncharacterized protein n=1 Tax=Limnoglobus roseus TaxID=2598579 RepID=A0A5C1AEZ5_9BACT|nr:hypothetical protein [Limnoglobus roseus]QEL16793.1 hypothetical protein PX52LOC_03766 [Limnoglobus roseus]